MTEASPVNSSRPTSARRAWLFDVLLIVILLAGALLRLSGLEWGEYQYLHPDERFLIWVGTDIKPVESLSAYFDTANSTLNPHNAGKHFYVYGTLPMFITRYVVEWVFGRSGFNEMTQAGRALSSLADILTVFLVYLVAERLYNRRVAILAAAFSAAAVLQIQQSHFFTMDTFINFFSFLAFYFAVRVASADYQTAAPGAPEEPAPPSSFSERARRFVRQPLFALSIAFGLALGMAVASKINAAPMAAALPFALLILLFRQPAGQRERRIVEFALYLALAALFSLLAFRIFQPYAFSGPGFFGLKLNPAWVANIRELIAQSSGDVDFPPAMQWARRPVWFSFQNLTTWGLGLPLGLIAWAGFLWVGWRLATGWRRYPGEWQQHLLIFGWTAAYFSWQSTALNPTMRYQLPIYPTLAIFAGWFLVTLYDYGRSSGALHGWRRKITPLLRPLAVILGGLVLVATYAYAYAFSQIYTRPITRIAASRWIYENIPGPVNLTIETSTGPVSQIIPVPYGQSLRPGAPIRVSFTPKAGGKLSQVLLGRVFEEGGANQPRNLELSIAAAGAPDRPLVTTRLTSQFPSPGSPDAHSYTLPFDPPLELLDKEMYLLQIKVVDGELTPAMTGSLSFHILPQDGSQPDGFQQALGGENLRLTADEPFRSSIVAPITGFLTHFSLLAPDGAAAASDPTLSYLGVTLTLSVPDDNAEADQYDLQIVPHPNANGYAFILTQPLLLLQGETYLISLQPQSRFGNLIVQGVPLANEGEWDDGLPVRIDGYDGFGGIYPRELNFNMYWDDNPDKIKRFSNILNQAEYILISSNRQWGTLTRLPERFPMTGIYYRALLGCPDAMDIVYCYRVAQPGMFESQLGFDLVQVFESPPSLGSLHLNDQFAEEAFTVYDHPKVLIFQKNASYDPQRAEAILKRTDFTTLVRTPPMRAPAHPANLLLPSDRWAVQQAGGTWAELFDRDAPHNSFQPLGVLLWYLCVAMLGLLTYPLLRLGMQGLPDGGYPLARTAGMLLLSYLVWVAGSFEIAFSRLTISLMLLLILAASLFAAYRQRQSLIDEWRRKRGYFLIVEILFLALFLAFLFVRLGNPDLWHPWKGGEKPMDFSYFNAVLKSTTFPPYDPWFAGGYLNYYYYGFVMVGVLVKWLGLVPSFAYNLILPTLFSMIAMGAFSLAWNLVKAVHKPKPGDPTSSPISLQQTLESQPFTAAIAAALGVAVLGNLGTVRMIFQGWQKLVAPEGIIEGAGLLTRWVWAARGFVENLSGTRLPYGIGDWYWIPSRAIPAPNDIEPITEFPYFTVLYADLHAHLIALPITLLALAGIASLVLSRARWQRFGLENRWLGGGLGFFFTALAIGALRPTNTWDFYPYLALGVVAILYTVLRYYRPPTGDDLKRMDDHLPFLKYIPPLGFKLLVLAAYLALFAGLSFILFDPYSRWYALGYSKVALWKGTQTPMSAYLTHWGLFLFVIVSWMAWESIDWMTNTPASALRKLRPYAWMVQGALALVFGLTAVALYLGAAIAWLVIPLAAWAGVLLLRPDQPDAKRFVLFLVGTALTLTVMVEVIVLVGDIGRMNTVFKFYLQAWVMLGASAAAALGWLVTPLSNWRSNWKIAWHIALTALVMGASLYTLLATTAKMDDRMAGEAPRTLDGMAFLPYATYNEHWGPMALGYDYEAMLWLQDNVPGSPVIVEANLRNLYRWGSRFTIYTGLPGVVGWEWHQQQQRAIHPGAWVSNRITEIETFYYTPNVEDAVAFLRKYNVQYIVLGSQERGLYAGPGLAKFEQANGLYWHEVYRNEQTVIYEVRLPW
jgi:YYY domain-containing protein